MANEITAKSVNDRLNTMWSDHIAPPLAEYKKMLADVKASVAAYDESRKTSEIRQGELSEITAEMLTLRAEISAHYEAQGPLRQSIVNSASEVDALEAQLERIMLPVRLNIETTTVEVGGKVKNKYSNVGARADALALALDENAEYQETLAALRTASLTLALEKAELEDALQGEKIKRSFLRSLQSQLDNLTARVNAALPEFID